MGFLNVIEELLVVIAELDLDVENLRNCCAEVLTDAICAVQME